MKNWFKNLFAIKERKTIRISPKSWHGKMYFWWQRTRMGRHNRRETLCHYWRVILLWSPLTWFFVWSPIEDGEALFTPFGFSVVLTFSILAIIFAVFHPLEALVIAVSIVAVIGAVVGIGYAVDRHKYKKIDPARSEDGSGFGSVLWQTVRAKKARICPFIEFIEEDAQSSK